MGREEFERQLELWLGFFREEALGAVDRGVALEHAMKIAMQCADSRLTTHVQRANKLALAPAPAGVRRN